MRVSNILILLTSLTSVVGCSSVSGSDDNAHLTDVGMFYVGGSVADGASQHSDQALVHYFKSDATQGTPVILYPGLGLSSYIYISTPDGRQGWAQQFAKSGHAAYVYDPVNTGPSGFPATAFRADPPASVSTWNINQIWPRWGFGPSRDEPYENVRFPIAEMDQFYASWPPRLASGMGGGAAATEGMAAGGMGMAAAAEGAEAPAMGMGMGMGAATTDGAASGGRAQGMAAAAGGGQQQRAGSSKDIEALIELLEMTGPAVLVPHSMGGTTVFDLANKRPDLVAGIVVIEPVGCPRNAAAVKNWAKGKPFLAVYGDYVDERGQTGRRDACRETANLVDAAGGTGAMLELTEKGIFGNTHLLMQDNNSSDIASRIIAWIDTNID